MKNEFPIYYSEYLKLAKKTDYRFKLLVDSLEFENGQLDRLILFEDILNENEKSLKFIFRENKYDDMASIAFSELTSLPNQTIRDNTPIFESIFTKALLKKFPKDNNDKIINNIRALFAKKKCGLSMSFIKDVIFNKQLDLEIKINLIQDISENDEYSVIFDWDMFDLNVDNYIIPGYMYFFHKTNPEKSFSALAKLNDDFSKKYIGSLYYPIEITILSLLIGHQKFNEFSEIENSIMSHSIKKVIKNFFDKNSQLQIIAEQSPEMYAVILRNFDIVDAANI